MTIPCTHCDATFTTDTGMRIHRGQVHGVKANGKPRKGERLVEPFHRDAAIAMLMHMCNGSVPTELLPEVIDWLDATEQLAAKLR